MGEGCCILSKAVPLGTFQLGGSSCLGERSFKGRPGTGFDLQMTLMARQKPEVKLSLKSITVKGALLKYLSPGLGERSPAQRLLCLEPEAGRLRSNIAT